MRPKSHHVVIVEQRKPNHVHVPDYLRARWRILGVRKLIDSEICKKARNSPKEKSNVGGPATGTDPTKPSRSAPPILIHIALILPKVSLCKSPSNPKPHNEGIYVSLRVCGCFRLNRGQKNMFGLGHVSGVCFGVCFEVCFAVLGS